ncbi:MAG: hypothetical protein RI996_265 [Candidatus Parcubacteria bacterium]|jgi:hypothetical protein
MDKININLNQNLWVVVISLSGVGLSEYYNLHTTFYFSLFLLFTSSISLLVTLFYYTKKYIKNKK